MLLLLSSGDVSDWVSFLVLQKQESDTMLDSSLSLLRRMLSCKFGNSGIALLSNEDNDFEVLSIA